MKLGQRMSLGQLEEMHQLALEGKNDSQGVHEEMGPG